MTVAELDDGLVESLAWLDAQTDGRAFQEFRPWVTPDGRSPQRDFIWGAHAYSTRVFRAGNRCGKSFSGAWDVAAAVCGFHPTFPFKPPLRVWASALDREFIGSVIWPNLKRWIPSNEIADVAWHRRGAPEIPLTVVLRNGSQIDFKSADSGRTKYQGAQLHLAWVDEEHPGDIMEEIEARLLDLGGLLNVTCTPLMRAQWLQDLERRPGTLVVRASMIDAARAGVLNLQKVLDYADSLPERQRRVRVLGDLVALEGAVFPNFRTDTHVARPRDGALWIGNRRVCEWPLPKNMPRHAAADFGISHPMAVGRAAHEGASGRLILERCWYASGIRFSRWAEILKPDLARIVGPLLCDRDANGRAEFEAAGIPTEPAYKEVHPGLELVERLLEPKKDGLPGIVLVEDPSLRHPLLGRCDGRRLAWEFEHYHYPENKDGKPLRADLPVKRDDDAVDMFRYLACGVVKRWRGGKASDGIGHRIDVGL